MNVADLRPFTFKTSLDIVLNKDVFHYLTFDVYTCYLTGNDADPTTENEDASKHFNSNECC